LLDEVLGRSDIVVEHVLLAIEHSGAMPPFAEFSVTSKVWRGIDSALVQPS